MSDTLLITCQGAMPLADYKALPDGQEIRSQQDKFLYWEALRGLVTTIGGQAAAKGLMLRQHKHEQAR